MSSLKRRAEQPDNFVTPAHGFILEIRRSQRWSILWYVKQSESIVRRMEDFAENDKDVERWLPFPFQRLLDVSKQRASEGEISEEQLQKRRSYFKFDHNYITAQGFRDRG